MSLRTFLLAPAMTAGTAAPRAAEHDGQGVGARVRRIASAPGPPVVGLVCERADGAALGATAALLLASGHRLPSAVVALHRAPSSPSGAHAARPLQPAVPGQAVGPREPARWAERAEPAEAALNDRAPARADPHAGGRAEARAWTVPAARRLAASLTDRGLLAGAAGRLATVALPDEPAGVLAAAERTAVAALSARAATVVVVAGARAAELDEVLARCDAVVVVTPPARAAVAGLAREALAALDVPVTTAAASVRAPARALAAAGLVAPPDLRAALAPALEGLVRR